MERADVLPNVIEQRARQTPDRTCIEDVNGESRTFGQLWDSIRRWSTVLADRGVKSGDRVVIMQPTSITAYELWVAVAYLRAIEVPINTQYVGDILAYVINNSEAEVMVCADRYLDAVLEQESTLSHLKTVVVSDVTGVQGEDCGLRIDPGRTAHESALPRESTEPIEPWDISTMMYTSGTTGPSKGVLVPWAQSFATATGSAPERALRQEDTVYYSPYPSFHVSGKAPFYGVMLGGGLSIQRERFDTPTFWSDIRAHNCTFTMLMGATAAFLYRQPETPGDADNPLSAVLFSPWTEEVESFKARFAVEAYSVFNMTEISAPIVAGWDGGTITKPKSCGRVRSGYELRIVDDYDQDVPIGTPGELIVRASEPWALMAGYWQMPEKTVEAWRNQWMHTGDLFSVDTDGDYYYIDRKKDSIRRRGENISSVELEFVVLGHPAVLEVAAVAVPDEISEQEVKIAVVLKEGQQLEASELHEFLVDRLPRFMLPRYIEFVENLPKTPTEKIRKNVLRDAGVTPGTWDREATNPRYSRN